jgi:anaerobic magnesium-protoporphyrin IX monomethyl ester cyclase
MKIALIQLPHFYGNGLSRPPECYPLGLGYISRHLTDNRIQHEGVDLWSLGYTEQEAIKKLDLSKFDFFGISAYSTQYKYLKNFSLLLKKRYPDTPILCGGPGPTFSCEVILKNTGVDVCVISEGEHTLVDLLQNFSRMEEVKGIAFQKNDRIIRTTAREPIADLDKIPFPDRSLFDFEKIINTANAIHARHHRPELKKKPRRSADIIAGRGCPYSCNYCSKTFSGVRLRSIKNLVDEIQHLQSTYDVNHLQFNDELVLVGKKRSLELCNELKKLNITWSCQGRINQVDKEILTAMKEAGCIDIGYGVESISQSILDRMNKRQKAETILPVIKMTKEIGINPIIQYMYGYPGENDQTIAATIRFFKEIDHPFIGFTTTPIPGTTLYQECLQKGLIPDEEEYLLRLDSGYNIDGAMINMTEFSDQEFLAKKRRLMIIITHNYLIRRPLRYMMFGFDLVKRRLVAFFRRIVSK